jgi:uncharacterized protein YciI
MKNFLIILRYKVDMAIVEEHTAAHRAYLKTQYDEGRLLMSGPFVPRIAGVLWAQAQEQAEVQRMIDADPFNVHGVADWEIIEFKPVMFAESLKATFEAQNGQ